MHMGRWRITEHRRSAQKKPLAIALVESGDRQPSAVTAGRTGGGGPQRVRGAARCKLSAGPRGGGGVSKGTKPHFQ